MWEQILEQLLPLGITLGGVALTALVVYLRKCVNVFLDKIKASDAERDAMDALMAGVVHVQESTVRDLKLAAADGKLTKEERKAVRDAAINRAIALAGEQGRKVLMTASAERLDGFIKQFLASWSKKK